MKFPALPGRGMLLFCLFVTLQFSCSKDSDLLADYISNDNRKAVVDDIFFVSLKNGSVVLDVLANDTHLETDEPAITGTTNPNHGSVVINPDNTLTYTPTTNEDAVDSFTYTTETVTGNTATGNVVVTISEKSPELLNLKAFPGAEGFGKNTTGGRGGRVIAVTNLNDSGSGSLRAALEATGVRTVVFNVSGTIECKSYLSIGENNGNITIAGQTAPGDGITIKGAELRIAASNVIVRYLRIRPGESTTGSNEDGLRIISFNGNRTQNVIIDHSSITWGKDEIVEIGGIGNGSNVRNVTIQNSIIGENISNDHKFGLILWNDAKDISIYKNLFVHNVERNIRSSTCTSNFEMINNIIYGFRGGTVPTYENHFDIIGNSYKTRPNLSIYNNPIDLVASANNCPNGVVSKTKAFVNNNILDGKQIEIPSTISAHLVGTRIFSSGIVPLNASSVEQTVLSDVGATKPIGDSVDKRLINETKNRTGKLLTSTIEVGGYPIIEVINRISSYDKDGDGMADVWELANGLNPNDPKDGSEVRAGQVYTNLELFLHMLTL